MTLFLLCDSLCNPDGVRTCELIDTHRVRDTKSTVYSIRVEPAYKSEYLAVDQSISTLLIRPVQDDWDLQYVVDHNQIVDVYVPRYFDANMKTLQPADLLPAGNGTLHASYQLAIGTLDDFHRSNLEN